jgi:hypothetical protein
VEGTALNALTFRGRAEKLGWQRGSVCDAGGIRFYHKPFQAAGAEALVELEDMYVGAGMDASITLATPSSSSWEAWPRAAMSTTSRRLWTTRA